MTRQPDTPHDENTSDEQKVAHEKPHPEHSRKLDRRAFIQSGSATAAAAAMGGSVIVYGQVDPADPVIQRGEAGEFMTVRDRPEQPPSPDHLQSLTPHEAETVDAITSRILPGSAEDPGAHEAGVVTYIDAMLAFNQGYAEFTYLQGPWAQTSASSPAASPMTTPAATPGATPMASPVTNGSGSGATTIEIEAGEYYFKPSTFNVAPGDTLKMTNAGKIQHDMAAESLDKTIIPLLDPGASASYTIPADADVGSSTTVYCTVPGHRELGMVGTMNITGAGGGDEASPQASPDAAGGSAAAPAASYDVVVIDSEDIERYGYQSRLSPRDVYRIGIAALDRHAMQQYEQRFKDLDAKDQDTIVGDMAEGNIDDFDPELTAQSFFQNLRRHTAEGMFSDPAYGGNRDMVGWKLVGYPGAQRAYMPIEFQTEGTDRQPQSMADMHHFNPGENRRDHDNVILPVSGSEEEEHGHDTEP